MRLRRSPSGAPAAGQTRPCQAPKHSFVAMSGPVSEDSSTSLPVTRILWPHAARWLRMLLAALLLISCKTVIPPPAGPVTEEVPSGTEAPSPAALPDEDASLKRQQAAAALTERGRLLMTEDRIDPAMRLFEQALSLVPQYGPGYYYLSEAWIRKNNWSQARAFHRQAALYLEGNGVWASRVDRQRRRIQRATEGGP